MKRILALLLALATVFALASCAGAQKTPCDVCVDEDGDLVCDKCGKAVEEKKPDGGGAEIPAPVGLTVADFAALVKDMNASRVEITLKETDTIGTLKATYKVVFGQGDSALISYTREVWDVSEDIFSTQTPPKKTVPGEVQYANGAYSGSMEGAASAVAKLALKLDAEKLSNANVNGGVADGARLTATVLKDNSAAVFGVALPNNAMLSVTLAAGAKSVSAFTLSYKDAAGRDVEFAVQYQ